MAPNSNIQIFLLCPVPENQKPINEFFNLQENSFLNWITFSKKKFQKKFLENFFKCFSFLNLFFFFDFSFNFSSFASFCLFNLFLTTFGFLNFFFLLYIRWTQLEKSFSHSRFFYEEGSWYDGQIWEKSMGIIKNDRLLSTQKIQPIVQRISIYIFRLSIFTLILGIFIEKN